VGATPVRMGALPGSPRRRLLLTTTSTRAPRPRSSSRASSFLMEARLYFYLRLFSSTSRRAILLSLMD
jgi:hypothetical protein